MTNNNINTERKPIPAAEWPSDMSIPYLVEGLDVGKPVKGFAMLKEGYGGCKYFALLNGWSIDSGISGDALFAFTPIREPAPDHLALERIIRQLSAAAIKGDHKAFEAASAGLVNWVAVNRPGFIEKMQQVAVRDKIKNVMRKISGKVDHDLLEAIVEIA